jgi:hypothetical protein
VVIALALFGCGDKDTDTVDETAAGPVEYAEIETLFARNCTTAGCHGGPELQTGLDLSAGVAYGLLVDEPSVELPSMVRVSPGDPAASYLFHKLSGTQEDVGGSGDVMPPGFGLATNDIALVERWIAEGAIGAPR